MTRKDWIWPIAAVLGTALTVALVVAVAIRPTYNVTIYGASPLTSATASTTTPSRTPVAQNSQSDEPPTYGISQMPFYPPINVCALIGVLHLNDGYGKAPLIPSRQYDPTHCTFMDASAYWQVGVSVVPAQSAQQFTQLHLRAQQDAEFLGIIVPWYAYIPADNVITAFRYNVGGRKVIVMLVATNAGPYIVTVKVGSNLWPAANAAAAAATVADNLAPQTGLS